MRMHTYTCCTAGTHLRHNLVDKSGNRYCINLVSRTLEKVAASSLLPRRCQRVASAPPHLARSADVTPAQVSIAGNPNPVDTRSFD